MFMFVLSNKFEVLTVVLVILSCPSTAQDLLNIVNPLRMRSRVTVLGGCVCVCVSVCLSVCLLPL